MLFRFFPLCLNAPFCFFLSLMAMFSHFLLKWVGYVLFFVYFCPQYKMYQLWIGNVF